MSRLPDGSALIEFRRYTPFDFKTNKYSKPRWAAYLLVPDIHAEQQVFFEDIGDDEAILLAVQSSEDKLKTFYQRFFGKFDKHISDVKILYIAPDGPLNLISLAALKLPDGKYLVERQQINQLQTGRDLLFSSSDKKTADILVAVGGVDYGGSSGLLGKLLKWVTGSLGLGSENKDIEIQKGQLNEKAANELKPMAYLKWSKEEANVIAMLYRANCKEGEAKVSLGKEPTESVLKNMEKPPRILHLSTHGFYLENTDAGEWADEQPLLLSGLAMANANLGLKGWTDDKGDDGLLYSIEVTGLNLQGTELVSLSACNTGKGAIDYSEGVYGLVRALRTAGAKNVLMTLTRVGDESSMKFFKKFYEIWLSSEDTSPAEALQRTRLHFIKEKWDPALWSPYVMVGG